MIMKRILTICALLLSYMSFSQIPNNGFENWINKGAYMDPVGWWTANDSVKSGSIYPVTMSTDHYPTNVGSYSIRLESGTNNAFPPASFADWGLTWTGGWNGNNYPAFAVTGHPSTLCGYYKWLPNKGDTMNIHAILYYKGVDIAQCEFSDSARKSNWTSFSVSFGGYANADSARIFMSCYPDCKSAGCGKSHNSVLYIDNLSFDSLITTSVPDVQYLAKLTLYPDPAKEVINLTASQGLYGNSELYIYDVTGRIVLQESITISTDIFPVDINSLQAGTYLLKVTNNKGSVVNRFVKE